MELHCVVLSVEMASWLEVNNAMLYLLTSRVVDLIALGLYQAGPVFLYLDQVNALNSAETELKFIQNNVMMETL